MAYTGIVNISNGGTGSKTKFGAQKNLGLSSYVFMANNATVPYTVNGAGSDWVHNSCSTHLAGPVDYSNIKLVYSNWYMFGNGEYQGNYDMYIRCSINYPEGSSTFIPVLFNGQRDVFVSKNFGNVISDPLPLVINANTRFKVYTRRTAADGGVGGSYAALTSTSGRTFRQDGFFSSKDPAEDCTLGVGIAYGAKLLTPTINDGTGAITSVGVDPNAKGIGYVNAYNFSGNTTINSNVITNITYTTNNNLLTSTTYIGNGATITGAGIPGGTFVNFKSLTTLTLNQNATATATNVPLQATNGGTIIQAYYGPAGANQPGSLYPGTGFGGFGNIASNQVGTITVTGGGTLHSSANPPIIVTAGSGKPASGFGSDTASYGPSCIVGIPAVPTPSLLIMGHSNVAGYGSADGGGTINGSHGWLEQLMEGSYGMMKLASPGLSSAGWLANSTNQKALLSFLVSKNINITHAIAMYENNDFTTNVNSNVVTAVQGYMSAINNYLKTVSPGISVGNVTVHPVMTGTYTTLSGQIPWSSNGNINYNFGGRVAQYNAAALAGTGQTNVDFMVDLATFVTDPVETNKWRIDAFGLGNAFTGDGTHFSPGVGIPFIVKFFTKPILTV